MSQDLRTFADQKTNIPVYAERKKHVEEKLRVLKEQEERKMRNGYGLPQNIYASVISSPVFLLEKKNIFLNLKERG